MYFKFQTKEEVIDFCKKVNIGEKIGLNDKNVTTTYADPIEILGEFYVIADKITSKYTDMQPIDVYGNIYNDFTPLNFKDKPIVVPLQLNID
jgi:hypothetical protein